MATSNNSNTKQNTANESKSEGGTQQGTRQQSAAARSDQERPIETGRDSERGDRGKGLTPRRSSSAAVAGSPFSLMQRMAEDMDRLFEQFGFGRVRVGLTPRVGSLLDDDLWAERGTQSLNTVW